MDSMVTSCLKVLVSNGKAVGVKLAGGVEESLGPFAGRSFALVGPFARVCSTAEGVLDV